MVGRGISAGSVMARNWNVLECLDAWTRADLPAIGLNLQQFDDLEPERVTRAVRASGLAVSSVQGVRPYDLREPAQAAAQRADLCTALDLAAELGAECVVAVTGPRGELSWEEAMARVLEQTIDVLPEFHARDLRLAIEPMSPIRQDLSFVNMAVDAVDIVRRVGDPSLGYVFDTYHLWWQRGIESLARDTADRVFCVQVSDCKAVTLRALDRAMPGAGVIPLPRLLHALADGGYDGWWELEVISDEVPVAGMDVDVVLDTARCAVEDAWARGEEGQP
jgi:sugar phosphate isomerase/epimerase